MSQDPVSSSEEFAEQVERFLASAGLPARSIDVVEWGVGEDAIAALEERGGEAEQAELAAARAWRRRLAEHGLHWITGPREHGGAGLTLAHQRVYDDLTAEFEVPDQRLLDTGITIIAPALFEHGGPRVREEVVPRIHTGEAVACQLFSEPGSGSDLAGASTRAWRVDGGWRVSGQKVWTSGAHLSQYGELLARTSPDKPKHHGLSMFVVDMHAEGVEVRPIRQMTGGSAFNEVFLDDVFVPDDMLLGAVDEGWTVARTTLMHERSSIGGNPLVGLVSRRLTQLVENLAPEDEVLRDRLAQLLVQARAVDLLSLYQRQAVPPGEAPGPEMSLGKLAYADFLRHAGKLATEVLGPRLAADDGQWGTFAWSRFVNGAPGLRIAGGTDQILRNIVAERVLGLPRDAA